MWRKQRLTELQLELSINVENYSGEFTLNSICFENPSLTRVCYIFGLCTISLQEKKPHSCRYLRWRIGYKKKCPIHCFWHGNEAIITWPFHLHMCVIPCRNQQNKNVILIKPMSYTPCLSSGPSMLWELGFLGMFFTKKGPKKGPFEFGPTGRCYMHWDFSLIPFQNTSTGLFVINSASPLKP